MIGASRGSLALVQESLRSRTGQDDLSVLTADLLAVAGLLGEQKSLRQTLADSGQPVAARQALVADVLGGKISAGAVAVVGDVVSQRWSSDRDLIDALELLAAQATFTAADAQGTLDRVENELFHFGRAVDASAELQMALTDPSLSSGAKSKVVTDLLSAKVDSGTLAVIAYFAGNLRGRQVNSVIDSLSELAAAQRNQVVAEVHSVVALDDNQKARLTAALTKITGRQVKLNVAIDPSVIGGISVKIGENIIDGTVATRLEDARRSLLA